jgi:hypothetical protein
VLVAGDYVIVRGDVTGVPSGELFGVPHSGNSYRIMAVDIQTIRRRQDRQDLSYGRLVERDRSAPREIAAASRPPIARFGAILSQESLAPALASCVVER